MAEPGSIADKVKQQADIVRVVGDYVRLKKAGQNFMGLCPFHSEKTPSFAVHPVKQIYHCFGCGVGGDVFKFVMEMEKLSFPEALRIVAEKCGIALPARRPRTPEEEKTAHQRTRLVELHEHAARFFAEQLAATREGKLVRDYLHDRGLSDETIKEFNLGYAPAGGDALVRTLRAAGFKPELVEASGLANRDDRGTLYDRFRRRIMFPIASESGRLVAFGGRAMGDDLPKYLNSPETPIYSKSRVLYNLHRAKEPIRRSELALLVEGYMDSIAVHSAGLTNVVATCGTSLTETQVRLLGRFSRRVAVSYDPDTAGQAATERSLNLLLEQGLEACVVALPTGFDPDRFIREKGADAYRAEIGQAQAYIDFLLARARGQFEMSGRDGRIRALNYLLPYLARVPNKVQRSQWAAEVAERLGIEEALLREELRRAATERRTEMRVRPEFTPLEVKAAERRLLQIVLENPTIRPDLLKELRDTGAHRGAKLEAVFEHVLAREEAGEPIELATLGDEVGESERRLLYELAFETTGPGTLEEARSCLAALDQRRLEAELRGLQREIEEAERQGDRPRLLQLLARKHKLRKSLTQPR
ncbi:MAG: DNA primase [Acidobacteria bacterium]|nr:DNA primase [Acidobacteriota bacterium]